MRPRFGHPSCITSSEEPPLFNFNSYRGISEFHHGWDFSTYRPWVFRKKILLHQGTPVWRFERDFAARQFTELLGAVAPVVSEERIIQGGKTYTTTYEYEVGDAAHHWADLLRPKTITEAGDIQRLTSLTYDYDFSANLGYIQRPKSQTTMVGAESFTTSQEHDDSTGFNVSRTEYGKTGTFAHDGRGNTTSAVDALGHATLTPHEWGVPAAIASPEGSLQRGINSDGTVAWEARAGSATSFTYDGLGRLTSTSPSEGASTTTTYAPDGRWIQVSRGPAATLTSFDGFGRPIGTENAAGIKTVTTYDISGRRSYQSGPFTGAAHSGDSFQYDELDRVTRVTHADGTFVQYLYSGTDVTVVDENGHSTSQEWKAFGTPQATVLARVTDSAGKIWSYSYNAVGNLTRVDSPEGAPRTWVYNSANQLQSVTQPEVGTTSYTYRADGTLYTKTDALGRTTEFTHDGDHRLIGINAPGLADDASFIYDARGNRVRAVASGVDTLYTYDSGNRLTTREDRFQGQVFISRFEYDARDNLTKITYPSGKAVEYEYDAGNRVVRVFSGSQTYASAFGYHSSGALQAMTFGNGQTATLSDFDARNRPGRVTSGPLDVTYTYDNVGNVKSAIDPRPGLSSWYDYDDLDRLKIVTGFGATTFTYDAQGNRLTKSSTGTTYTYNASTNRLMTATSAFGVPESGTFTYDAVGNMLGDGTGTYTYSATNQMVSATLAGAATSYAYDADGLRTEKTTAAGKQYFIHGPGSQLLAEYAAVLVKLAPTSGSATNNATRTISWASVPGAEAYAYCVHTVDNNCSGVSWTWNGMATTKTLNNLAPGTYYWQAWVMKSGVWQSADNGAWWSFTVTSGGFAKLGPMNASSGLPSSITLQWAGVPDSAFWVCWDTTNNNSCDGAWTPNGAATSKLLQNLAPGVYYWQVRAQTPYEVLESDGGEWWRFTVGNPNINVAASANGGVATASSTHSPGFAPSGAIDGNRKGDPWGWGVGWNDASPNDWPDALQVSFAGAKTVGVVDVFSMQDNYEWPVEPTPTMTFSTYGLTDFVVEYWNGSQFVTVPNGTITGNDLVRRRVTFPAVMTTAIRITVTGALATWTRVVEVEAYAAPPEGVVEFSKLAPAHGLDGLSSNLWLEWAALPDEGYSVCFDTTNNGQCDTTWWPNGGATTKLLQNLAPGTYYWQVKRASNGAEANAGIWWAFTVGTPPVTFDKQTPAAGAILTTNTVPLRWNTAPGAIFYETCLDATNNGVCDAGWQMSAMALQRTLSGLPNGTYYWQVRAQTSSGIAEANGGTWWVIKIDVPTPSREYIYLGSQLLAELSYAPSAPSAPPVLTYYHTDLLGSVRAITNTTGATVTRNDYLPFGENTPLTGDSRRFTGKELDFETAFHYFDARYFRNVWGRFTTADPLQASARLTDPQSFNRYAYAFNNPLRFVDPNGLDVPGKCVENVNCIIVVNLNVIFDSSREWTAEEKSDFITRQVLDAFKNFMVSRIILNITFSSGKVVLQGKNATVTGVKADAINVAATRQTGKTAGTLLDSSGNPTILIDDRRAKNPTLSTVPFQPYGALTHEMGHIFHGDNELKIPRNFFTRNALDVWTDPLVMQQWAYQPQMSFRRYLEDKKYALPLSAVVTTPKK